MAEWVNPDSCVPEPWCYVLGIGASEALDALSARGFARGGDVFLLDGERCTTTEDMVLEFARACAFPRWASREWMLHDSQHYWRTLDMAINDLSWLPATSYTVMIVNAERLLPDAGGDFDRLLRLLRRANAEWMRRFHSGAPHTPKPFRVVFQCEEPLVGVLSERIERHLTGIEPWCFVLGMPAGDASDAVLSIDGAAGAALFLIRGSRCATEQALLDEFGIGLHFPPYYGRNWDALNDCIKNLSWLAADGYTLLVTNSEGVLAAAETAWAFDILVSILESCAEKWRQTYPHTEPHGPKIFHVAFQCEAPLAPSVQDRLERHGARPRALRTPG